MFSNFQDNNGTSPQKKIPGIEEVVDFSGAAMNSKGMKYFKSQADLFAFIKEENQKILERHIRLGQSLSKSKFLQVGNNSKGNSSQSNNNNNGSNSINSITNQNNQMMMMMMMRQNSGSSTIPTSASGRQNFNGHANNNNNMNQKLSDEDVKPIEEKLLRPFCVHIDASVAPSSKASQNLFQLQQQQNQSRFFSISGAGNKREQGLLAMFSEAGTTQKEKLTTTVANSSSGIAVSGTRRQREEDDTTKQEQQQQQVQTRFFVALTREKFARVARGDIVPQLPQDHQHFFEIIEENAPCVLYFDVEMEPHTALTETERKELIQQVEAVEKNVGNNNQKNNNNSVKNTLPRSLRKKLHCCPVDCNIEFDETKTRDVLIAELKKFLSPDIFPLPILNNNNNNNDNANFFATVDENSFIVLVSPSKGKFSQHYIIRFREQDARFANNNIDQKLVVSCFVDYLYERAFEDPVVHSALFYHESVDRRNCVVSLNSAELNRNENNAWKINEDYSFANSPAQIRAQQLRQEKEKRFQELLSTSTTTTTMDDVVPSLPNIAANFSVPAISLKCIIDEAVYTKNRMMRCYGSSKVGKCAILDFDHHWHQGGRLNHYQMNTENNREGILASTLISEPIITVTDEKLRAANLFRVIDSSSLLASALARGNRTVQGLQIATTTTMTANGGIRSTTQQIISSGAFNASDFDTTNFNSAAALVKFPLLCKEIVTAQVNLERPSKNSGMMMMINNNNNNNNNIGVESIQLSVPKQKDDYDNIGESAETKGNYQNFHHLRLTVKIKGTRFCHVVKRQHRSNGVFWIVKCSLPTSTAATTSNINMNGYGSIEQKCFDDDCKTKLHTLKLDLSEAALCEIRILAGLGNDVRAGSTNLSSKMVVLNKGGNGTYLSHAARQILESNPEYQKQQQEEQQQQHKQRVAAAAESERLIKQAQEQQQQMNLRSKATKWIPPNRTNAKEEEEKQPQQQQSDDGSVSSSSLNAQQLHELFSKLSPEDQAEFAAKLMMKKGSNQ